eukprot:GHVU01058297.1.p1 GENE.GHVU01058297.1~~GHVU01058297.1.p1  ORF type:complete len:108 (+),score=18.68 GHVU01058297.1:276-599(+)
MKTRTVKTGSDDGSDDPSINPFPLPSENTKGSWHDAVMKAKMVKEGATALEPVVESVFTDSNDRHIYMRLSDDTWMLLDDDFESQKCLDTLPTKLEFLVIPKEGERS